MCFNAKNEIICLFIYVFVNLPFFKFGIVENTYKMMSPIQFSPVNYNELYCITFNCRCLKIAYLNKALI